MFIYFIMAMCIGCKAQTIIPLYNGPTNVNGAYYKDTFNDLNRFEGTWKYTNGTTSLTITLQKKEMQNFNDGHTQYYEDVLIGAYRYIENGAEKINTLSQLDIFYPNFFSYPIAGDIIAGPNTAACPECEFNERKVLLSFSDPTRDIPGMESVMAFIRSDEGNIQKLNLVFYVTSGGYQEEGQSSGFDSYTVPFGEYLLVKQP